MRHFELITGMAMAAYIVRLSGFGLSRIPLTPFAYRALSQLPIAVFTALVAVSVGGQAGEGSIRLMAAVGAGIALWYKSRPWVGLLVGMSLFWLLRLVG